MKKVLYGFGILISLSVLCLSAWLFINHQAKQPSEVTLEPVVEEAFMLTSIHPRPRPSDVIVIGNHWVFAHELLDCSANPICNHTPRAEAGDQVFLDLSLTELEQQRVAINAALREAITQP